MVSLVIDCQIVSMTERESLKFHRPISKDVTYLDNNVVLGAIADGEAAATGTTCDVLWEILKSVSLSSLCHLTPQDFPQSQDPG